MARQGGTTRIINMLKEQGFVLPAGRKRARSGRSLRPDGEIIRRLMVVKATALWVTAPEDQVPSQVIRDAVAALAQPGQPRETWLGRREQGIRVVGRP